MRPEAFFAFRLSGVDCNRFFSSQKRFATHRGPALFEKYIFLDFQDDITNHCFLTFYFLRNRFFKKGFRASQTFIGVNFNFYIILFRPSTFVLIF